MYHQKKPNNTITSHMKHYEHGEIKEQLNHKKHLVDTEDIIFHHKKQIQNNLTSTQESLQKNNQMTSKTKLSSSNKNILTTLSSKTLDRESTIKGKDLSPLWTNSFKEKSKKLWLPIKTDYQDLDLTSSNIYHKSLEQKSLFSQKKNMIPQKNSQKILCQSSQSSVLDTMVSEITLTKTKKIRIYPNQKQIDTFGKFISTSRYIYNNCIEHNEKLYSEQLKKLEDNKVCNFDGCGNKKYNDSFFCSKHSKEKIKWNTITSPIDLRNKILIKDKDLKDDQKWLSETPYDTKELMIRSYITSLTTNMKKSEKFKMEFKSKKELNQIFFVNKKTCIIKNNSLFLFKNRLKTDSKIKIKKKVSNVDHNFIILKQGIHYFLLIPHKSTTKYQKANYDEVALDPGVRTFQTFYSPEGICGDLNLREDLIKKLKRRISKLEKQRICSRIKRKLYLSRTKINNLINDGQWKIVKFLVENFNKIILPKFETQKMVKNGKSKLRKNTKTELLGLSHYKFQCKLKFKCLEYQRKLIICGEEYTSKTCGRCGILNNKLVGKKIFKCDKCELVIDRDLNGARNIYLKNC